MTILALYGGPLKRDLVQMAYEECGQADYNYQLTPEEYSSALRKLDAMLNDWKGLRGIDLGYNFSSYGAGSPEDESGIPDFATQVVSVALGFRIFPSIGKSASGETKATLASSVSALRAQFATVPTMNYRSTTPRGAGNTRCGWRSRYYPGGPWSAGEVEATAITPLPTPTPTPDPDPTPTYSLDFSNAANSGYLAILTVGALGTPPSPGGFSMDFSDPLNSGYLAALAA